MSMDWPSLVREAIYDPDSTHDVCDSSLRRNNGSSFTSPDHPQQEKRRLLYGADAQVSSVEFGAAIAFQIALPPFVFRVITAASILHWRHRK